MKNKQASKKRGKPQPDTLMISNHMHIKNAFGLKMHSLIWHLSLYLHSICIMLHAQHTLAMSYKTVHTQINKEKATFRYPNRHKLCALRKIEWSVSVFLILHMHFAMAQIHWLQL